MILDSQLNFSDSQAVTASAVGTNVIDLSVDRSIGSGEPMAVMFVVEVDADATGAATINFQYFFEQVFTDVNVVTVEVAQQSRIVPRPTATWRAMLVSTAMQIGVPDEAAVALLGDLPVWHTFPSYTVASAQSVPRVIREVYSDMVDPRLRAFAARRAVRARRIQSVIRRHGRAGDRHPPRRAHPRRAGT